EADLRSAAAIAAARGIELRSIVFPRNQIRSEYLAIVRRAGFDCFRGNRPTWPYHAGDGPHVGPAHRATRLIDTHVPLLGSGTIAWTAVQPIEGVMNVPASLFLRPTAAHKSPATRIRARRMRRLVARAGERGEIAHIWWHPHNFGAHVEENLALL